MIQLASDPNASRVSWQTAHAADKAAALQAEAAGTRRHAWPFISRYAEKAAASEGQPRPRSDHGS